MKKVIAILSCVLSLSFFGSVALAAIGEGTVDQIRVCGASGVGWNSVTYFKLSDGQWFWVYSNHKYDDRDSNDVMSVIMSAHASRYKVKVDFTETHSGSLSRCGVNAVSGFNWQEGDYIAIIEYDQ